MKVLICLLFFTLFTSLHTTRRRHRLNRRIMTNLRNRHHYSQRYRSPTLCHRGKVYGTCLFRPTDISNIEGRVEFSQELNTACIASDELIVSVDIRGLDTDNGIMDHGLHVHQFGDLADGCLAAGPHFNPLIQLHGGRSTSPRHLGDLGNVREETDGSIKKLFRVPHTSLIGSKSIIGRALVLHAMQDDLGLTGIDDSSTTGNSGSRLACCVIGHSNEERNTEAFFSLGRTPT